MFRIACGRPDRGCWGIAPSEFWQMCPYEWWLLFDANVGEAISETENSIERLHRMLDNSQGKK